MSQMCESFYYNTSHRPRSLLNTRILMPLILILEEISESRV